MVGEEVLEVNIPAGDAAPVIRDFADAHDLEIIYSARILAGVRTRTVQGRFTAHEALARLLENSGLEVYQDLESGALLVRIQEPLLEPDQSEPTVKPMKSVVTPKQQTLMGAILGTLLSYIIPISYGQEGEGSEIYELSPFEISTEGDYGYRKTNAMTATRIGTPIIETPLSISVVSDELRQDLAIESSNDLFYYTASVNTNYDTATNLLAKGDDGGVKIRGFGTSFIYQDGIRRFNAFHIDGIDRTEVVKGPVGLYFGRSDPGGIINFVSKKPEFVWDTSIRAQYGSDNFYKGVFDHQGILATDTLGYLVTLSKRDSDDWFDDVTWDEEYLLASLRYRPSERMDFMVQYENFDQTKTGGTAAAIVLSGAYMRALDRQGLIELAPGELVGTPYDSSQAFDASAYEVKLLPNGLYEDAATWGRRVSQETGRDLRSYDSFWFPRHWTWSRNGKGTWDNNQNESLVLSANIQITDRLNARAVYSTVETDSEVSWFINQDPHQSPNIMAAFATGGNPNVFTSLNYGFFISPSFAPDGSSFSPGRQADLNDYDTLQVDLTYAFEWLGAEHTLVASFEQIDNTYTQVGFLTDRDAFIAAGGIPGGVQGFGNDAVSDASNALLVQRRQQLVDWGLIGAEDPFPGRGPWSSLSVDVKDPNAVIPNMREFILGRTTQSRAANDSEDRGLSFSYLGKFMNNRLHVLGGVRQQDYQVRNAAVDTSGVRSITGEWEKFSQTVYTAGLNYFLSDELVAFASYSENFVPSTTRNQVWENRDTGETIGGERVDPQSGEGIDVGLKAALFGGKISGSVSVFQTTRAGIPANDLQRALSLLADNEADGIDFNGPWFNAENGSPVERTRIPNFTFAGGEQQVQGIETEIIWTPNANFQGIFAANYYWQSEWTEKDAALVNTSRGGLYAGNYVNDGFDAVPDRLENVPDFSLGVWGAYSFTEGVFKNFKIGLGGNYESDQIHEVRSSMIPWVTESWWRLDAMMGYRFGDGEKPWSVQLNVSNVLDEKYITGSFGISPTRQWKLTIRKRF